MTITAAAARAAARELAGAPPETIIRWAADRFSPRVGLTCSFSGPGVVLAHLVARVAPAVPVIFLDTGYHFAETLALKDEFARRYPIRLVEAAPRLTPAEQAAQYGEALYERDPDQCCRLRKVEPMAQVLADLDCWITGLRRDQSVTRAAVGVVEQHQAPDGRPLIKVMPLAHWSSKQVWDYIMTHGIPYNPLLDQGYKSIGCRPCTVPVAAAAAERDGRWAGQAKTECGLHTFTRRREEG